ncbi:MAG: hypothetical protein GEU94_08920 [Micromonosporaceae bacterium]|nr:hypothetical protein [Micromonosporaceae bacterium]
MPVDNTKPNQAGRPPALRPARDGSTTITLDFSHRPETGDDTHGVVPQTRAQQPQLGPVVDIRMLSVPQQQPRQTTARESIRLIPAIQQETKATG